MKQYFQGLLLIMMTGMILSGCTQKEAAPADPYVMEGEKHFKNIKMLTNGGENAEAYLSFSETKLSYQATFGDYQCDQVFTMNIDGSGRQLISTGKGRTTCAFYLPGDSLILYASTHLAGDDCPPPPDRSRGYVWQLYNTYDIFVSDLQGNVVRQLTDTPGYDAEAVVSPLGDKIAFTSTRDGDPEIYIMDLDGGNQTRLTFEKGYDGEYLLLSRR